MLLTAVRRGRFGIALIWAVGAFLVESSLLAAPADPSSPARLAAPQTPPNTAPEGDKPDLLHAPKTKRRGGFVLGASGMYGTALVAGYPNKVQEIGDPDYRVSMDAPFYSGGSLFIGGAIRDYLTVALALTGGSAKQGGLTLSGGLVGLRIESYPGFALGGAWEDIGLVAEVGAGSTNITDAGSNVVAEGGSMRSLGVGAFWQPWQWWHFAFGPGLMFTHQSSDSMHVNAFGLALRSVFYGNQP